MKLNSIKLRLTLFYTLVVFVLFAAFNGFLYLGFDRLLEHRLNKELLLFADAIEDSYNPAEQNFGYLEKGTENYENAKSGWVRIFLTDGSVYFTSDRFVRHAVPFPWTSVRKMKTVSHIYREFRTRKGKLYRSIILPVIHPASNQLMGWVEVAQSLKHIRNSLAFFRKLILVSLPVLLIVVAILSYFMVYRAFKPVSLMARQTDDISHRNLYKRLPVMNPNDELGRLASRFNELLERLENSFRNQQRLLSDVAHELKTPLAILRSHWEEEIENPRIPAKLRQKLSGDVEELARLAKMVNDLSLLSQSLEIAPELAMEPLEMGTLLDNLQEDARALTQMKQQQLTWETCEGVRITGDQRYLRRLFLNLIDNAVKYTPEKGTIQVHCRRTGRWLQITVADNGMGISPDDLPHVFERFYRGDKARNRDSGGSGLGLSICRWLAEAHGGRIEIDSAPGRGTRVRVFLPVVMMSDQPEVRKT